MSLDIVVPALGESISEATVLNWRKGPGDPVARNEVLVELETDKVTVEVEAPEIGTLLEVSARDGDEVAVGSVIGRVEAAAAAAAPDPSDALAAARSPAAAGADPAPAGPEAEAQREPPISTESGRAADRSPDAAPGPGDAASASGGRAERFGPVDAPPPVTGAPTGPETASEAGPGRTPAAASARSEAVHGSEAADGASANLPDPEQVRRSGPGERITADDLREFLGALDRPLSPAVRRAVREHGVDPAAVAPTGPRGRIVKEDVPAPAGPPPAEPRPATAGPPAAAPPPAPVGAPGDGGASGGPKPEPGPARVRRVPMSRLRRRLAERLKEAQSTAALLTTYNELDMSAVAALRKANGDAFRARHGVRLGLMSFFVKACVSALRTMPELNAEIDGTDIVYKNFVTSARTEKVQWFDSESGIVI